MKLLLGKECQAKKKHVEVKCPGPPGEMLLHDGSISFLYIYLLTYSFSLFDDV